METSPPKLSAQGDGRFGMWAVPSFFLDQDVAANNDEAARESHAAGYPSYAHEMLRELRDGVGLPTRFVEDEDAAGTGTDSPNAKNMEERLLARWHYPLFN